MNLNIKYFGLLVEVTQCSEETLAFYKNHCFRITQYTF